MLYLIMLELIYLIFYIFAMLDSYRVDIFKDRRIIYKRYGFLFLKRTALNIIYVFMLITIIVLTIVKYLL